MKIKQYDKVLLKGGNTAYIVEIFDGGKLFLADIDKDGDTYTEEVRPEEIKEIYESRDLRIDGEYDRPLPERIEQPTPEDQEKLQQLIEKYKKMAEERTATE